MSRARYANCLKAMRVFFRDYLKRPELVSSFQLPKSVFKPKQIPSREEIVRFYQGLERPRDKALFLMYCTTGLRYREVLDLKTSDVDFEKRMVLPNIDSSTTKQRWVSFFNSETENALREYLESRTDNNSRLFPLELPEIFRREFNGVKIHAQLLRDWFCCEMGSLGVQDRYVDAFCGRVPQSILARHYTDYSPERLKEVYERTGLKVLN
jgi:integrase